MKCIQCKEEGAQFLSHASKKMFCARCAHLHMQRNPEHAGFTDVVAEQKALEEKWCPSSSQ